MRAVSLPEVAYGATAVRPDWDDLPTAVRDGISARLGSPVTAATSAGGGFTRAFAALLTTAAGDRVFVKAEPLGGWYAREASITAALPAAVPAARPRWTLEVAGHYVLCLEAVPGHVPALPWAPGDLSAALTAWRTATVALEHPGPELLTLGLPRLGDIVRDELSWWSEIAAGRELLPPAPDWVPRRLGELAELERALPELVVGNSMLHGDLRVDNVLLDGRGGAWLCDWTWPCLGQPWFDTVTLLVTAYASGLDADAALAPWQPPADGVDGALAALGGYWLTSAASGPSSASPHSRQHQRFSGTQALAWLAERRGWAPRPVNDLGATEQA
jgi:phosphotransferase family enzyme